MTQQHHRGAGTHGGAEQIGIHSSRGVDLDPHDSGAALGGDALDEVAVGGEIVTAHDDLDALGVEGGLRVEGRAQELVQQHGRGVADHGLTGGRSEGQAADAIADEEGEFHPVLVPAADEAPAPLLGDEARQPLGRGAWRAAQ
ncbi:hypothetical protein QE412_002093 [Microbacterium trichothecenolyticum]|uniref:Uncharacterized protein n=1 Tax=Microbacterium trichothecenolyticum TaxID=69370 RepID=A0ABU0TV37_MICTR|nr:hypothetical protein [Microbacterium trichothecenolyticum]